MTIKEFFKKDLYAELTGAELIEVDNGRAVVKMEVRETHFNAGGVVQGGAVFTLADLAFAAAAVSIYKSVVVSIETDIRFFKSTNSGTLYAKAKALDIHHKLGTFEVRIVDEKEQLIALFTATGYRKDIPLNLEND
jgi:acyl-CoA thioesterase